MRPVLQPGSERRRDMTFWIICPHRVQKKSFQHTSRDSTTGDMKASVFCNVSARSGHFVNVDVIFLPSVCDSFCGSTISFGQGCRSLCHELYEQSTVVFCRVDEMRVLQLFVFFVPTMFSGILGSFGKNSTVLSPFWSACKHS